LTCSVHEGRVDSGGTVATPAASLVAVASTFSSVRLAASSRSLMASSEQPHDMV
jgi:hypothetical protein